MNLIFGGFGRAVRVGFGRSSAGLREVCVQVDERALRLVGIEQIRFAVGAETDVCTASTKVRGLPQSC
jgi:hypothetical protein